MREAIEQRIREYLAETDPRLEWVREAVRAHHLLPLCFIMSSAMCIRPDGSFVWWSEESAPEPLLEARLQRGALYQGSKRWPELAALLPPSPFGAIDCDQCRETKMLQATVAPNITCWCGGIGWVMADERMRA